MNCLAYSLRFWNKNPKYKIYYNSDHAINSDVPIEGNNYMPLEKFTLRDILLQFVGLLNKKENILLVEYFNENKDRYESR